MERNKKPAGKRTRIVKTEVRKGRPVTRRESGDGERRSTPVPRGDKPRPFAGNRERPERSERTESADKKRRPLHSLENPERSGDRKQGPVEREEKPTRTFERKTSPDRPERRERSESADKKRRPSHSRENTERSGDRKRRPVEREEKTTRTFERKTSSDRPSRHGSGSRRREEENLLPSGPIRLNRYISNAGICSRREADRLIEAGAIKINGKVVTELGTKVLPNDKVQYGEQALSPEKPRYVLLNKPKGFITTTDDPENRRTVMNLVAHACKERIYPVGRLDRNTTGLLLLTNDGELAKRLSHPKFGIKKIYHVVLDRALAKTDLKKIEEGIELEDGLIKVDAIEYVGDGKDKKELGIELHSGKNRIVRRIFEQLEYKVVRLDRVGYAGLTKKNLSRGEWRFLEEKELNILRMST